MTDGIKRIKNRFAEFEAFLLWFIQEHEELQEKVSELEAENLRLNELISDVNADKDEYD